MIRRYEPRDFEDVLFLEREFYLQPASPEELRAKLENPAWVADDAGVVGHIITCPDADNFLIWSIIVAQGCRGQGAGSSLLEAAINYYDSPAKLYVEPQNLPAISLYKKFAFRESRTIENHYGEGYPALEMTRDAKLS